MKSTNNQECRLLLVFSLPIFSPAIHLGKKNNQVFNYATSLIMSSSLVEWCCLSSRTLAEIVLAEVAERLLVIVFPSLFSSIRAGVTLSLEVSRKKDDPVEIYHIDIEWTYTKKIALFSDWDQKWAGQWQMLRLNGLISQDTKKKSHFIIKHTSGVIDGEAIMSLLYCTRWQPCVPFLSASHWCVYHFKAFFFLFVNTFSSLVLHQTQKEHVGGTKPFFIRELSFRLSNWASYGTSLP